MVVDWTDAVGVDLVLVAAIGPSARAACYFHVSGASGSISIPPAALSTLGAGAGLVSVAAEATKVITIGTFPTTFYAGGPALNVAKTAIYQGSVTWN